MQVCWAVGYVVSVHAIDSYNLSLNPTEVYSFYPGKMFKKNENKHKRG